jgi:hypothetical protein
VKVGSLYSIGLPRGWRRSTSADAVSFSSPGGGVEVRVFSEERPDLDVDEVVSAVSASVLAGHPEATLRATGARSIRGAVTRALIIRYPWGREHALIVAAGPHRYLVVSRVSEEAARHRVREAGRVRASFHPL